MEVLQRFREIRNDPESYARQWKRRTGGPVIGTFCSYAPEALILAGGALAFRLVGGGDGRFSRADAHLQSYGCSLVRGTLDAALGGRFDFLDGVLFPHTCDSLQRLSDIWRINVATGCHLDVVLPVKLHTPSAQEYYAAVLRKARDDWQPALGKPVTDGDLRRAIGVLNGIAADLERLDTLRRERPGLIAGSDMHAVCQAAMTMDRHEFGDLLGHLVEDLESRPATAGFTGKRLLLAGGVCHLPDLFGLIESAGGVVVGDDLCTGIRGVAGPIDIDGDPLAAIARRYSRRVVCPAKHAGITHRADALVRLARQSRAQGVILVFLKFCDPHAFDYPYLKSRLEAEGLPSLLMEMEAQIPSEGQLRTRCEAFLEMLP